MPTPTLGATSGRPRRFSIDLATRVRLGRLLPVAATGGVGGRMVVVVMMVTASVVGFVVVDGVLVGGRGLGPC